MPVRRAAISALHAGARLRAWRHDTYRTTLKEDQKKSLEKLSAIGADSSAQAEWEREAALADGVEFTRELVAEPANVIYPEAFVDRCKARMEAVRHSVAVLLNHAQQAADLEQSRIADTLDLGRRTVHLTTLLAIIGLLFYLRQNHAMQGAQVRHSEELARERDHLEQVVQRRTEELARLNLHLQTLREGERGRFARTLHDDLGAALAAAKMDLTRLRKSGAILDKAWLERLQHLDQEISDSISIKRRIMEELMPPALHNLGLRPALELLADDIRTRSPVRLQLQVDDIEAGEACRNAVYRVVQEALSNVLQHAKATQVFARVTAGEQAVRILVRDNGAGFDRDVLTRQGRSLLQLRYRVELVGGSFHVETSPGHGTEIRASVPLVQ